MTEVARVISMKPLTKKAKVKLLIAWRRVFWILYRNNKLNDRNDLFKGTEHLHYALICLDRKEENNKVIHHIEEALKLFNNDPTIVQEGVLKRLDAAIKVLRSRD